MSVSSSTPTATTRRFRWRIVDIVVASVIGVASGLIFLAWNVGYVGPSTLLEPLLPGLQGLLDGPWLFAGVLGALVIRKPGAAIYTELLAAVVSALVGNQWGGFLTLEAGFVQGLGAAATRVIALAAVRDTHAGRAMAATMSMVMMVFMVVPIIAPFIGQGIIMVGPWQHIFWFMALLSIVMTIWCFFRLPETLLPENRRSLALGPVLKGFQLVVSNRISLFYTLATAFFFGSLFAFLNLAQPILGGVYGLHTYFPLAMAVGGMFMSGSSFLNSRIVGRLGMRRLSHGALVAHLAISLAASVWFLTHDVSLWLFMFTLILLMPLFGLIGANFNSIAMEPLGKVAGTASSVLGFTQTVGGGLVGAAIGQTFNDTATPLIAGTALTSLTAMILVLIAEKGRLFSNPGAGHGKA